MTSFEAHPDYIRANAVHPTQPFVLTASDDMTIKLWDWEKGVEVRAGGRGPQPLRHQVMSIAFNPKRHEHVCVGVPGSAPSRIWSLGTGTAGNSRSRLQ